jgi:hypothetical protein
VAAVVILRRSIRSFKACYHAFRGPATFSQRLIANYFSKVASS